MRSIKWWWGGLSAQLGLGRSNGIRVRRATFAKIHAGNDARERRDWPTAAHAYRAALTYEPQLHHLWMQLGHMEKEAGAIDRAIHAYAEAARLRPDDAEALLHLGHMAKAWGQPTEAAGHFIAALRRNRGNLQALSELARLLPDRDHVEPALWSATLDVLQIDPIIATSDDTAHVLPPGAMVFDVTDLLAFFGQRRLPTGIQRVQIEVSLACLEQVLDPQPIFCVYASARRGWIRLQLRPFETLCRLARQSDDIADPAWVDQLDHMYRRIAVARTLRFAPGTILINLGTSWSDRNYLLDVRIARARDAILYVPLVFDLIPLIGPHWFLYSLVRDYRAWFESLLHSADGCLAISEATREDLLRSSAEWGAMVPEEAIPVVRLDGDFRQPAADSASLHTLGLQPERYVLFVSTLEPRKNHRGAFEAWLALAETIGEAALPRLVCVGGRGWLNEDLHQMLRDSPKLRRMVLILHGISDDMLAALYEHCLFALYPSFYEGWGLPVSEALSYGKVPAISRVSSLPEAGGHYARYFDPSNVADIAASVRTLFDEQVRRTAETEIRQTYTPRTWHQIAHDVVAKARSVTARGQATLPRLADTGVWTFALPQQIANGAGVAVEARQGEALRHGRAWQAPGLAGCRIDGDDAALWFHWAGGGDATLQLHFAPPHMPAGVRVVLGDVDQLCLIQPGTPTVVSCPLPAAAATLWISITPTAGDIIADRIVITRV